MHHIRLMGLILFITTIFLGLAAAATQTRTIKVKKPSWGSTKIEQNETDSPETPVLPPAQYGQDQAGPEQPTGLEFMNVPVVWPLCFFGILGLAFWFVPAGVTSGAASITKTRSRKKRRKRR